MSLSLPLLLTVDWILDRAEDRRFSSALAALTEPV